MEDLWRVRGCGIDLDDISDQAEYRLFIKRFHDIELSTHRSRLLFGHDTFGKPQGSKKS